MAISKKPIPSKSSVKLTSLEQNFYDSLTNLTNYAIKQENQLSDTLDTLNAKLKKALLQQKTNKTSKKNITKAVEKKLLKAQIDIDTLELDIALTTDKLSLMTQKIDHLLAIDELPTLPSAPVKTKKVKVKTKSVKKTEVKTELKKPKSTKTVKKTKPQTKQIEQKTEEFDLSEFFTPDMDFGFVTPSEAESKEPSANIN